MLWYAEKSEGDSEEETVKARIAISREKASSKIGFTSINLYLKGKNDVSDCK